jgi:RNA polymerase sigma-70 factor (ECF subfamily)
MLYAAHCAALRSYVHRRVDSHAADDVVADVFVVAWRRLGDVPEDALPWLIGVARRMLANRWRGESRYEALRDRIAFERRPTVVPAVSLDSAGHALRALSVMREGDREALLLIAWEGLTPAQAAHALGVSANTFSARLSRARRRFGAALARDTGALNPEPGAIREGLQS